MVPVRRVLDESLSLTQTTHMTPSGSKRSLSEETTH